MTCATQRRPRVEDSSASLLGRLKDPRIHALGLIMVGQAVLLHSMSDVGNGPLSWVGVAHEERVRVVVLVGLLGVVEYGEENS